MGLGRLVSPVTAGALLLAGSAGAAEWHVPGQFPTIQAAIDSSSVHDGDTITVSSGRHKGATVTKAITIRGLSGATITSLHFLGVAFAVFSRGADFVSVTDDLRGMDVPVALTPDELVAANTFEGNLTGPLPDEPSRRLAGAAAAPIR